MEYRIADYLAHHKEGLKTHLKSQFLGCDSFFLAEVRGQALSEIAMLISPALNLNYEECAEVLTEQFVLAVAGEDFFDWSGA